MELLVLLACTVSTGMVWGAFYLVNGPRLKAQRKLDLAAKDSNSTPKPNAAAHAQAVGEFYDETTDAFLKVYGDVIQAFRTRDLSNLLGYQANVMQLKPGMKILDAGCGVCGPAMFFAKNHDVTVDAITASSVQQKEASQRIIAAGLEGKIRVQQGDYHQLSAYFPSGEYDVVYFLESFGHSADKVAAIASAWEMLKPGGMLYIKDLFIKEPAIASHAEEIKKNVERINEAYRYHVGDLNEVLTAVRKKGYILSALKTIDIPLEDFENLTISNDFQELTGIHRIDNLQEYLFPVDFFELICIKPWHDLSIGNSRYFLQNLYYLKVHGKSEAEL
ncbi:MAG: class I SAM-dependent methyltransferase [Bacteroidetes bacterium]|nr:class I SAM-dependent methyltransferase [Bacteroidota bacterium]